MILTMRVSVFGEIEVCKPSSLCLQVGCVGRSTCVEARVQWMELESNGWKCVTEIK